MGSIVCSAPHLTVDYDHNATDRQAILKQCIHLCVWVRARVSVINRFSSVLVWCIHYCASAHASDALVLN